MKAKLSDEVVRLAKYTKTCEDAIDNLQGALIEALDWMTIHSHDGPTWTVSYAIDHDKWRFTDASCSSWLCQFMMTVRDCSENEYQNNVS